MKKKIVVSTLLFSIGLMSCKEEFLEVTPNTILPSSQFWRTSNDAQFGINSIYGQLAQGEPSNGLYGGPLMWLDVLTDDAMWLTNANATASGSWGGGSKRYRNPCR